MAKEKVNNVFEDYIYNAEKRALYETLTREEKEQHRATNWAFVLYPESAPEDWENRLGSLLLNTFYILHDQDLKEDGTPKKPHYHIMWMFGKLKKSPIQVYELAHYVGGDGVGGDSVIKLADQTGYARYLTHIDHADKHQYSVNDVKVFGGKDYLEVYGNTYSIKQVLKEMSKFVRDKKIRYFVDLCDYAEENRPDDWYDALTRKGGCSYYMREYVKSASFKEKETDEGVNRNTINELRNKNNDQYNLISELRNHLEAYREIFGDIEI